jgi:hypothetical protein
VQPETLRKLINFNYLIRSNSVFLFLGEGDRHGELPFVLSPDGGLRVISTMKNENILTPWPLIRKRTIPTERPPLVDEI